jgi:hypothetical protein
MAELRAIAPLPRDESAIESLEHVLAEVRAGRVSMVAIAWVDPDGCIGSSWSHVTWRAVLLGAVEMLRGRILAQLLEHDR